MYQSLKDLNTKSSQNIMKRFFKNIVFIFIFVIFSCYSFFGNASLALAQAYSSFNGQYTKSGPAFMEGYAQNVSGLEVLVNDPKLFASESVWKPLKEHWDDALKFAAGLAIHSGLRTLVSQWAHDIAVKIASGNKDEGPWYEVRNLDQIVTDAWQGALGLFIETVGEQTWGESFNLCNFDPSINIKIALGLFSDLYSPEQPECSWKELTDNITHLGELDDVEWTQVFKDSITPESSEAGAFLRLSGIALEEQQRQKQLQTDYYKTKQGWLDFRDAAGFTQTPAETARELQSASWKEVFSIAGRATGNILADAATVFTNTLVSEWIKRLLSPSGQFGSTTQSTVIAPLSPDALSSSDAEAVTRGVQGAEEYYKGLQNVSFVEGGNFDVLLELASGCSSAESWKCRPNQNVITESFRSAIEQELTVGQALEQGTFDGNIPFGFGEGGKILTREEGYPYRSILILRRYRIVPVGWEMAAEYIRLYSNGKSYSLNEIVSQFSNIDSPFYGFIDSNWVLKSPANYCKKKGAGSTIAGVNEITGTDLDGDGDLDIPASFSVIRDNDYCADERGCIREDENGKCLQYGYCTTEGRIWNFEGAQNCSSEFRTCEAFADQNGQTVSYLANTLDYEFCNESNVGCTAYCTLFSPKDNVWRCTQTEQSYNLCDKVSGCSVDNGACTILFGAISCSDSSGSIHYYGSPRKDENNDIYLDNDAESCAEEELGCSSFFSINSGTNLIANSGFEYFEPGTNDFAGVALISGAKPEVERATVLSGEQSLLLSSGGTHLGLSIPIKTNLSSRIFSFSFSSRNRNEESSCEGIELSINDATKITLASSSDWERYGLVHTFGSDTLSDTIVLAMRSDKAADPSKVGCIFDEFQLEENNEPNRFHDYTNNASITLKKSPSEFFCEGYTVMVPDIEDQSICESKGYFWRNDIARCAESGNDACKNFALYCSAEEVGCEQYSPTNGDPSLTSNIGPLDSCPFECVGYDTFKQEATFFEDSVFPSYFIPQSANLCQAQDVGCDEFTNLDEIAKGGEGLEYYSYGRQCKTDTESCGTFYSWVGSEDSGYQLRTYSLLTNQTGSPSEIENELLRVSGECNSADDAISHPECKQFFDVFGNEHYAFLQNTLSCTDACSPYRKTIIGTVEGPSDITSCKEQNGDWSSDTNTCYLCTKFNGSSFAQEGNSDTFNDNTSGNEACIFHFVPNEGIECSPQAAGCREYTGNAGSNIVTTYQDNFESGTKDWFGGTISGESTVVAGHSLKLVDGEDVASATCQSNVCEEDNGCLCQVEDYSCYIEKGQSFCGIAYNAFFTQGIYRLTFWAKAQKDMQATLKIQGTDFDFFAGNISLDTEWNQYTFGPIEIKNPLPRDAKLVVQNEESTSFYIDNVQIRELEDTVYVIKNSWKTPESCDQDSYGAPSPQYMLGCSEYENSEGELFHLKSFESLCRDEVAGCEAFIDTENSSSPFEENFGEGSSEITVKEDSAIFLVDDDNKKCDSNKEGCSAFGKPVYDSNYALEGYTTAYLINDPEKYDDILCSSKELWCDAFATNAGTSYFKNPLTDVCDFREAGNGDSTGWYRVGSSSSVPDCPVLTDEWGQSLPSFSVCQGGEKNGKACYTDSECDSEGICVSQHFVGLCPATESGCTEYIEPTSTTQNNKLLNSGFELDEDSNGVPDSWDSPKDRTHYDYQAVGENGKKAVKIGDFAISQKISLSSGMAYTISARIKKERNSGIGYALFGLQDCKNSEKNTDTRFLSPDGSVDVVSPATALIRISDETASSDSYFSFSGRISVAESVTCDFVALSSSDDTNNVSQYWFDELGLRETEKYYKIRETVDTQSCAEVDSSNGCVLFQDRGNINYTEYQNQLEEYFTNYQSTDFGVTLSYDSDQTQEGNAPSTKCANGVYNPLCDSNIILKVKPDRECKEWLYCSTVSVGYDFDTGQTREICLDVGACSDMDENGNCVAFVNLDSENLTFNKGSVEQMANLTGYSKTGYDWGAGKIIEGYYPSAEMKQVGGQAGVPNGNFEIFSATNEPFGWQGRSTNDFENGYYRVIGSRADIQQALQVSILSLPPDGLAFLELRGGQEIISSEINVFPHTEYTLGGIIHTALLFGGVATIKIEELDALGNSIVPPTPLIIVVGGQNWTNENAYWITSSKTSKIRIHLEVTNDMSDAKNTKVVVGDIASIVGVNLSGNAFFDGITLNTSLEMRNPYKTYESAFLDQKYMSRSCRLYADQEAPACSYIDSDGFLKSGWEGYCVERDPENPQFCITWWPVDQIAGNSVDANTFTAYKDRFPLYMCMEFTSRKNDYHAETPVNTGLDSQCTGSNINLTWSDGIAKSFYMNQIQEVLVSRDGRSDLSLTNANNWTNTDAAIASGAGSSDCNGGPEDFDIIKSCSCQNVNIVESGGSQLISYAYGAKAVFSGGVNPRFDHIELIDQVIVDGSLTHSWKGNVLFKLQEGYCTTVAQVVSPFGESKAWTEKLDPSSKYQVSGLQYTYQTDFAPFGGIVPPNPQEDPLQWDGLQDVLVCDNDSTVACTSSSECQNGGNCTSILNEGNQPIQWQVPDTARFSSPYQIRFNAPYSYSSGDASIPYLMCSETPQMCYYDEDCPNTGESCNISTDLYSNKINTYEGAAEKVKGIFAKSYGVWEYPKGVCNEWSKKDGIECYENDPLCEEGKTFVFTIDLPDDVVVGEKECYDGFVTSVEFTTSQRIPENKLEKIIVGAPGAKQPVTLQPPDWRAIIDWYDNDNPCSAQPNARDLLMSCTCHNTSGVERNNVTALVEASFVDGYFDNLYYTFESYTNGGFGLPLELAPLIDATLYITGGECSISEDVGYTVANSKEKPGWNVPTDRCGLTRSNPDSYCAVDPLVKNIKINEKTSGTYDVFGSGSASLTFNSVLDTNQLPLTAYTINWQDKDVTSVSGLQSPHKPNVDDPHKLVHFYSYWDIYEKFQDGDITSSCATDGATGLGYCDLIPTIQIFDNWEWCNASVTEGAQKGNYGVYSGSDQDNDGITDCADSDIFNASGKHDFDVAVPYSVSPIIIRVWEK